MPSTRAALAVVAGVVGVSLITGALWPVWIDNGGESARNPVSRYGPHWLYPTLGLVILIGLLIALVRAYTARAQLAITAFAAGAASNLAQWIVLGGVRNPVGPMPDGGHMSIGDLCLWIGILSVPAITIATRVRARCSQPRADAGNNASSV